MKTNTINTEFDLSEIRYDGKETVPIEEIIMAAKYPMHIAGYMSHILIDDPPEHWDRMSVIEVQSDFHLEEAWIDDHHITDVNALKALENRINESLWDI